MKDLISVIVLVYNREKVVGRCLEHLINQSYKNLEIICVNDGSKDKSLEILQEYAKKDSRIKIINNPKNMGIAYSRNAGLDAATAEYIMWCDSDDWYDRHMCKTMLKAITQNNVDYAECPAKIVYENENLGVRKNWNQQHDWELRWTGKKKVDLAVCRHTGCFLWNKIFKKSFINKYGLRIPNINTHEDTIFVSIYIMLSKNAYFVKEKLYYYVIHSGSTIDKVYEEKRGFTEFEEVEYFSKWAGGFIKEHGLTQIYPMYNELLYTKIFNFLLNASILTNNIQIILGKKLEDLKKKFEQLNEIEVKALLKKEDEIKLQKIAERNKIIEKENKIREVKFEPMDIFFTADDKYAEHLATTLVSILLNANYSDEFNFHILDGGISWLNKRKILKLKNIKSCNIEFLKVDTSLFKNFPLEISYMSLATYYKYLIPRIKRKIKRALYLDCDLIVRDSLHNFYYQDFKNKAVVVCDDAYWDSDFAKKYKIKNYFNAGVMLIDCVKWRAKKYIDELFKQTKLLKDDIKHEDQDVLNYVLKNDKLLESQRYNLQVYSSITHKFNGLKKDTILSITANPAIVHYNTKEKPWTGHSIHPYTMEYFIYKNKTPFKNRVKKDLEKVIG